MSTFNFWFIVAPLGALVATWLGYRLHGNRHAKFIRRAFATATAAGILTLFFVESFDGAVQFCIDHGEPATADFVAIFALVGVAVIYGLTLAYLGEMGEYLHYAPDERKALRKARKSNPAVEYVITSQDLQRILKFVRQDASQIGTMTIKLSSLPR